ncbi:hypothetical protein BOTNAR_0414g00070 [Botryotinia narcissicola]|uniref:Uncharacterized protein n=1 Tax=Botryotinia narcissicola TaxID=278944 RepID=A0A4Z1HLF0_9HELO|nr:hypothetical protein BOTNAR_0414g00070 [Botryotinia narcissicola]
MSQSQASDSSYGSRRSHTSSLPEYFLEVRWSRSQGRFMEVTRDANGYKPSGRCLGGQSLMIIKPLEVVKKSYISDSQKQLVPRDYEFDETSRIKSSTAPSNAGTVLPRDSISSVGIQPNHHHHRPHSTAFDASTVKLPPGPSSQVDKHYRPSASGSNAGSSKVKTKGRGSLYDEDMQKPLRNPKVFEHLSSQSGHGTSQAPPPPPPPSHVSSRQNGYGTSQAPPPPPPPPPPHVSSRQNGYGTSQAPSGYGTSQAPPPPPSHVSSRHSDYPVAPLPQPPRPQPRRRQTSIMISQHQRISSSTHGTDGSDYYANSQSFFHQSSRR